MSDNSNEVNEEEIKETVNNARINTIGVFLANIYVWVAWGQENDFLRWGFLGYLIMFGIVTSIPKIIVMAIFVRDGVFSTMEQIGNVIFNFALVYFLAPIVIGWFN